MSISSCEGRVGQHRDFIGQRLDEPLARRQLEPAHVPVLDDVRTQNTGLERREKRSVRGQKALFAFGRDGNDEFCLAVEFYSDGCDERERNGVGHVN